MTLFVTTYGIKIIGAIIILILGRIAAGIGRKVVKKVLEKPKTDPAVISFVGSMIYFLILIFVVLAALAKYGIQTASFVAILGAAGCGIGFALQGALGERRKPRLGGIAAFKKETRMAPQHMRLYPTFLDVTEKQIKCSGKPLCYFSFNPDCAVASYCDLKILAVTLVSRFCSSTYL